MLTAIVVVFLLGYTAIVLEHPLKIDKSASALLTGTIAWAIVALFIPADMFFESHMWQHFVGLLPELDMPGLSEGIASLTQNEKYHFYVEHSLGHHLNEISQILFFLLGAMTIVELIDGHEGFRIVTDRIRTTNARKLLWIISIVAFFFSAMLDNLTTSIVMVTLLRKLIEDRKQRIFFAGIVIVAANAGGAWSPIGDVTTTMLWIGGQITTVNVITTLIFPSIIAMIAPLIYLTFSMSGKVKTPEKIDTGQPETKESERKLFFFAGVSGLIFVPIFKTVTHLPPYVGMMFSLGFLWVLSELIHSGKAIDQKKRYSVGKALSKIDAASVLFFLGILLAISALQSMSLLNNLAQLMSDKIGNMAIIVYAIGLASAVIDNVPLVAATMGMYSLDVYPTDHPMWEFLAYCAGTGGSVLIIGSAAGVAVMGMEKIDFIWYVRKISLLAFIGYTAGALAYLGQIYLTGHLDQLWPTDGETTKAIGDHAAAFFKTLKGLV